MIRFMNNIEKGGGLDWQLAHPEFVVCEVHVIAMNNRNLSWKCNLHPASDALISVDLVEKKLAYRIKDVCCDSFLQDLEQLILNIRKTR